MLLLVLAQKVTKAFSYIFFRVNATDRKSGIRIAGYRFQNCGIFTY